MCGALPCRPHGLQPESDSGSRSRTCPGVRTLGCILNPLLVSIHTQTLSIPPTFQLLLAHNPCVTLFRSLGVIQPKGWTTRWTQWHSIIPPEHVASGVRFWPHAETDESLPGSRFVQPWHIDCLANHASVPGPAVHCRWATRYTPRWAHLSQHACSQTTQTI